MSRSLEECANFQQATLYLLVPHLSNFLQRNGLILHFQYYPRPRSNHFVIDTLLIHFPRQISPDFHLIETSHLEIAEPVHFSKPLLNNSHPAAGVRHDLLQPVKVAI